MIAEKRDLMKFYGNHFSTEGLEQIIETENIETREFAFKYTAESDSMGRPVCFNSLDEMVDYLSVYGPNKVYVGGFYARRFPEDKGLQAKVRANEWAGRELCFDIDMDHYMNVRKYVCDCGNAKTICDDCLVLAKDAVYILVETLVHDFAVPRDDIIILFSGRQGFHIWVRGLTKLFNNKNNFPPSVETQIEVQLRTAIAEYVQLITEKERRRRVKGRLITEHQMSINYDTIPKPLRDRVLNFIFPNLVLQSPDSIYKEFKGLRLFHWKKVKKMLVDGATGREAWDELRGRYGGVKEKRMLEKIIELRYPRYDVGCTKDIHRIMKIPFGIDGSTGNQCVLIDDLDSFSLNDVPNIKDLVK